MSLKLEFVERARRGEKVADLAAEFGITRAAGYKWLKRFEDEGVDGLEERSRRPNGTPLATAEELVLAVLKAREAHPNWGPRKLEPLLRRKFGEQTPKERTIARIIQRAKLVRKRRKRYPVNVVELAPTIRSQHPNDIWTVDFKGWWRAQNSDRCQPLTIRDAFSRFVLAVEICPSTVEAVREVFERVFRKHGLPNAIQCDNGEPFVAVIARCGLSKLSAWWTSLGIRLIRSRPGCPQDNGGHERMHADIAADVELTPGDSAEVEQRRLKRWRQEFNHVRPHDALDGKTPAEVYKVVERRPFRPVKPNYPAHLKVRRVSKNGRFSHFDTTYFLSQSLAGFDVGIEVVDSMRVRAWFYDLDLGVIEVVPEIADTHFDLARRGAKKRG